MVIHSFGLVIEKTVKENGTVSPFQKLFFISNFTNQLNPPLHLPKNEILYVLVQSLLQTEIVSPPQLNSLVKSILELLGWELLNAVIWASFKSPITFTFVLFFGSVAIQITSSCQPPCNIYRLFRTSEIMLYFLFWGRQFLCWNCGDVTWNNLSKPFQMWVHLMISCHYQIN